jgi:magnesium transporter
MSATGVVTRDANLPRSWLRESSGALRRDLLFKELPAALENPASMLWVDVDMNNRHQLAVLEKVFRFHPLSIEDTLNPNSRVKLDEYDGYLFVVIRGVEFDPETPDPLDLATHNICFFLGKNFIVTTHTKSLRAIDAFAQRCDSAPDALARGPARVMYSVMDATVDAYFPVLDQLDEFISGIEERMFTKDDPTVLQEIFEVKRTVLTLKRHLAPEREVFNALANRPTPLLAMEEQRYLRDVYDHVLRINDMLDQYRDLLSSVLESSLTQISNRLGQVTKGLAVVATVSVPFVVVSGMWGMNFADIPLSGWPHGFWVIMLIQIVLGGLLLAYLNRKGWM